MPTLKAIFGEEVPIPLEALGVFGMLDTEGVLGKPGDVVGALMPTEPRPGCAGKPKAASAARPPSFDIRCSIDKAFSLPDRLDYSEPRWPP